MEIYFVLLGQRAKDTKARLQNDVFPAAVGKIDQLVWMHTIGNG